MKKKDVSINFCGGCNSSINRGLIAGQVRDFFISRGHNVSYNRLDADTIVFISGCTVNCAQKDAVTNAFYVVVASSSIDSIQIDEENIVPEILSKVG